MTYGCLSLCGWTSLLQARTPVGREGHLGMKIRYPMECFNRKKMSILRMSVFPWKCVIMQQDVWWGTGCVNVCLHAILTVCESACDWAADCVAYSIVIHAWSVHSYRVCLLHPSQGHLSIQLLWADLHQQSICTFPDDAAVLWVVVVYQQESYDPFSHLSV